MAHRVVAVTRDAALGARRHWHALCDEMGVNCHADAAAPVDACTVVFKDTRSGVNAKEDDEICAYVAADAECELRAVHDTPAEERLRLWVSKALTTAELHCVRQVLVRLDLPLFLSRCPELLSLPDADGDGVTPAVRARRRAAAIVVEAVESFMCNSGVVWRCVLMGDGEDDAHYDSAARLLHDALEQVQLAKIRGERARPLSPSPARGFSAARRGPVGRKVEELVTVSPSVRRAKAHPALAANVAPYAPAGEVLRNERLIYDAALQGVTVSEEALRALFRRIDVNDDGCVSVNEVSRIFMQQPELADSLEVDASAGHRGRRGGAPPMRAAGGGSILSPLGACGLPVDLAAMGKFVRKYCRAPNATAMTFPEFSIMMLSIAKR
jgi:hypothetical protein